MRKRVALWKREISPNAHLIRVATPQVASPLCATEVTLPAAFVVAPFHLECNSYSIKWQTLKEMHLKMFSRSDC